MPRFPEKAYKNMDFLNSPAARHIRILCEYEEARQRFEQHGIDSTIVFFGSARTLASEDAEALLVEAHSKMADSPDSDESKALLRKAEIAQSMGKYYDAARELAHRLRHAHDPMRRRLGGSARPAHRSVLGRSTTT